jgi:hypothetical protein
MVGDAAKIAGFVSLDLGKRVQNPPTDLHKSRSAVLTRAPVVERAERDDVPPSLSQLFRRKVLCIRRVRRFRPQKLPPLFQQFL